MISLWVATALVLSVVGMCFPSRQMGAANDPADCDGVPYAEAQVEGAPRLQLELAITPEQRTRGLMFRESLPADYGMLFVNERPSTGPFWNMNTLIPLSIAFLDRDGTILNIQDMRAISPGEQPTLYGPNREYWYALETGQGWFATNGVVEGHLMRLCLPRR